MLSKLKARQINYRWLNAHYSIDVETDSINKSFSGIMRICKDSLVWLQISTILGIEAARVLLTHDSIKFMDRIHETYFKSDYSYLDSALDDAFDLDMMRSVLIGSSVEFYEDTSKIKTYYDGDNYILSTIRKRMIKKMLIKNKNIHSRNDVQLIWLNPLTYRIERIRVEDFVNKRTFEARYSDFSKVEADSIPFHILYTIVTEKSRLKVELKYSKVHFKETGEAPFFIPASYARLQPF